MLRSLVSERSDEEHQTERRFKDQPFAASGGLLCCLSVGTLSFLLAAAVSADH